MKNAGRNSLILLAITIVVLFFILKDDFFGIYNTLINANLWWVLVALIVMFLSWVFKALSLHTIVKEHSKKIKFPQMLQQQVITQFFNGITPFSTGGQPMQIYMLKKSKIKLASATNIIVQSFILYQMALIVHGIIALILNYKFNLVEISSALSVLIMLGFIINILVGIALLFISFSTKFNNMIGTILIKVCAKLKIVKDKEKTLLTWKEKLAEYHESATLFREKKMIFIKGFCYDFISLFLLYIIPLFVMYAMVGTGSINLVQVMVTSAFVLIIGNFVPIPGGSGGIEYGFLNMFNAFVTGSMLSGVLIVWRFITYYLGVIIGGITLNFFKGDAKTCE